MSDQSSEQVPKLHTLFPIRNRTPARPRQEQTIKSLHEIESIFERVQEYLEAKIQGELEAAMMTMRGNKEESLKALRKKLLFDSQLIMIDKVLNIVEFQRETLELANLNIICGRISEEKEMADRLKTLTEAVNKLDVEQVIQLIEEFNEAGTAREGPDQFLDKIHQEDLEKKYEALLVDEDPDLYPSAALSITADELKLSLSEMLLAVMTEKLNK